MASCRDAALFTDLCRAGKTSALVLRALKDPAMHAERVPEFLEAARRKLRMLCYVDWAPRRLRLEESTRQIREGFSAAGIPFAFLRGLPLAARYYLSPEVRISEDIDLLIPSSARDACADTLLALGFGYRERDCVRECRADYMGQTEFVHAETGVMLDLNWRLTGNASIGDVPLDMDAMWQRAVPAAGAERLLSPEDDLVNIVRHYCHGHDFGSGLLKACVDVTAILRCQERLDWDYVRHQVRTGEFARGADFFHWFYADCYLQDRGERGLGPISMPQRAFSGRARAAFGALVRFGEYRIRPSRRAWLREPAASVMDVLVKIWSADRGLRVVKLLRTVLWPSHAELTLLSRRSTGSGRASRRIRHSLTVAGVLPIIALGLLVRAAGAALGFLTAGGRQRPNHTSVQDETRGDVAD
ncbi:MAG: nucleotidyltransferase family protein [bacterium]|nr:nucleotidyltransferase family protein [bacterium]